jgi:serine/threonine-protein kinase
VQEQPTHDEPDALEGIPKPGDVIGGKYEIEGMIGLGGMGAVLAGTHLHLQQPVAIKVLLPAFVKNSDVRGRFLREARAAARLRSDHVTRTYDVGALENGIPYMVMERLEGTNLAEALDQEGALTPDRAVGYVLQACEALAEAHAAGIVHRDLKPANLFLAEKPNGSVMIKVLDFGISKSLEEVGGLTGGRIGKLTGPHSLLGSPHYMSPEQVRDSSEVDSRTDIWALGVILYELLTGKMPFEATSLPHLYALILSNEPLPLDTHGVELPMGVEAVILSCLEKNRSDRIQDVGVLAERLAPFGPSWAVGSVEHIRHALEGRTSSNSLRPHLAPVASAPTPTRMGSDPTLAAQLITPTRSRKPFLAFGALAIVLVLAGVVGLRVAEGRNEQAAPERATAMLSSISASTPDRLMEPLPPVVSANEVDASPSEPVEASIPHPSSAPPRAKSAPERDKRPEKTTVRDLKSITLLD